MRARRRELAEERGGICLALHRGCVLGGAPGWKYRTTIYYTTQLSSGDQAGSEAAPGYGTGCRTRPVTSTVHSLDEPPESRSNIRTRPFGAQVGPSSWNPEVSSRSSEPSGFITPMRNSPP